MQWQFKRWFTTALLSLADGIPSFRVLLLFYSDLIFGKNAIDWRWETGVRQRSILQWNLWEKLQNFCLAIKRKEHFFISKKALWFILVKQKKKLTDSNEESEKFKHISLICGFGLPSCITNLLTRKSRANVILMNRSVLPVSVLPSITPPHSGLDLGVQVAPFLSAATFKWVHWSQPGKME